MNFIFCKLKKPQKTCISFFASLKNLKKREFHTPSAVHSAHSGYTGDHEEDIVSREEDDIAPLSGTEDVISVGDNHAPHHDAHPDESHHVDQHEEHSSKSK